MPRTRWWLVGSMTLVGLLTWLGGAIQPAFAQDHDEVTIVDFAFEPTTLDVSAGATVSWTNTGQVVHTVTADNGAFNSGEMSPGATVTGTFDTPGTYTYHCSIHASMTGTLIVTAAGETAPAAAAPATEAPGTAKNKGKDTGATSQSPQQTKLGKVAGVGVGTAIPHDYTLVALAAVMALLFALASRLSARRL